MRAMTGFTVDQLILHVAGASPFMFHPGEPNRYRFNDRPVGFDLGSRLDALVAQGLLTHKSTDGAWVTVTDDGWAVLS